MPLPWLALGLTLGLSACLILFTALRLRAPWPVTDQEYAVQLACDLIIHSTLLYYSGGSTNLRFLLPGTADHRRCDPALDLLHGAPAWP